MSSESSINRRQLLAMSAAAAAIAPSVAAQASSEAGGTAPDLSGKSILITGSSSGFGRLGAEHYARLGAKVFATMRNLPRPEADELRELATTDNLDITVIEIDVTSDTSVEAGVAEALSQNDGKLDVLVNNAGVSVGGPVELQDMEAAQLIFDTNVMGCHRMARAVLPSMRAASSGHIVNISSQLGRLIIPGFGLYSSTKFAVEGMSEQMAYELVPHGIDVTIIQPGGYPTKIWSNNNLYSQPLKERADQERVAAYPALTANMGARTAGESDADPMDIPRAIAEITAMAQGTRPLRRSLHPVTHRQVPINEAAAEAQIAVLGETPLGPWVKAVHNR